MGSETFDGDYFHELNLQGKNNGATMNIQLKDPSAVLRKGLCINIYVNNNVQGVNNSVVMESEVKMTNPGVAIYLDGLKFDRRAKQKKPPRPLSKRKRSKWGEVEISRSDSKSRDEVEVLRSDSQLGSVTLPRLLLFSVVFFLASVFMSFV